MILKKLEIHNYGPFSSPATLEIEDTITVLTGRNDVGKSSILRLLKIMYLSANPEPADQNLYRYFESQTRWENDTEIFCTGVFMLTEAYRKYIQTKDFSANQKLDIKFHITQRNGFVTNATFPTGESISVGNIPIRRMPKVLILENLGALKPNINPVNTNTLEQLLLITAFGNGDFLSKINGIATDRALFRTHMRAANERINSKLRQFLPLNLGLELLLEDDRLEGNTTFTLAFKDSLGADTPVHYRGSGITKLLSLMVTLMDEQLANEQMIILADEPETSLHADAQHLFRKLLSELAKHPHVQVIYTTHSPSMIDVFNPTGVRLLERTQINGKATTIINNKPYSDNFLPVRIGLGMSPADSLLYAPITVIVEGDTETICLPSLLKSLYLENIPEFEDLNVLFPGLHFLSGNGANFSNWCQMAKSQGSKPVIFVDGDKIADIKKSDFAKRHPDVAVVHLPEGMEFEQLVPSEIYFAALQGIIPNTSWELYQEWEKKQKLHPKMMFTKRIDKWLVEELQTSLDKPKVMKKALELVNLKDLMCLDVLKELVSKVRDLSKNL